MIVTSRKEIYYKVEMTAEQAHYLHMFIATLQQRHIDEICKMANTGLSPEGKAITERTLKDLQESLVRRKGD